MKYLSLIHQILFLNNIKLGSKEKTIFFLQEFFSLRDLLTNVLQYSMVWEVSGIMVHKSNPNTQGQAGGSMQIN